MYRLILYRAIADLNNMALGRSLVGNVHLNDNDGVSLVLWDTSGDNEDININQTLLDRMKHHVLTGVESLSQTSSMPSLEELSHNGINQVTPPVTKQPSGAGGGVTDVVVARGTRGPSPAAADRPRLGGSGTLPGPAELAPVGARIPKPSAEWALCL